MCSGRPYIYFFFFKIRNRNMLHGNIGTEFGSEAAPEKSMELELECLDHDFE